MRVFITTDQQAEGYFDTNTKKSQQYYPLFSALKFVSSNSYQCFSSQVFISSLQMLPAKVAARVDKPLSHSKQTC